jgi:hypothetical protein
MKLNGVLDTSPAVRTIMVWPEDVNLICALNESGGNAGVEHGGGLAVHSDRHGESTAQQSVRCQCAAASGTEGHDVIANRDCRKDSWR